MPFLGEKTHPAFQKRLRGSNNARWVVGWWLGELGMDVRIDAVRVSPTRAGCRVFTDHGDLIVRKNGRTAFIVEVKQLTRYFTGRADWPFGTDFIVDQKKTYDGKKHKPRYYVVVDPSVMYAAILDCRKGGWREDVRPDRNTTEDTMFYFCPIDDVIWRQLPP